MACSSDASGSFSMVTFFHCSSISSAAAVEVLEEEWQRRSWSKLPAGGGLEVEGTRLG